MRNLWQLCVDKMTKIKICGIRSQEDIDICIDCGVDYIGFIFAHKSPRAVSSQHVGALQSASVMRVGVFVDLGVSEIKKIANEARLDWIQLHGAYSPEAAASLGAERVIKVLWPEKMSPAEIHRQMEVYAPHVSYFLLDSGANGGGHGVPMQWDQLRSLRVPRPYFLAGGLGVENVARAIDVVHPYAVDMNSALEKSLAEKDAAKIKKAVSVIRNKNNEKRDLR